MKPYNTRFVALECLSVSISSAWAMLPWYKEDSSVRYHSILSTGGGMVNYALIPLLLRRNKILKNFLYALQEDMAKMSASPACSLDRGRLWTDILAVCQGSLWIKNVCDSLPISLWLIHGRERHFTVTATNRWQTIWLPQLVCGEIWTMCCECHRWNSNVCNCWRTLSPRNGERVEWRQYHTLTLNVFGRWSANEYELWRVVVVMMLELKWV